MDGSSTNGGGNMFPEFRSPEHRALSPSGTVFNYLRDNNTGFSSLRHNLDNNNNITGSGMSVLSPSDVVDSEFLNIFMLASAEEPHTNFSLLNDNLHAPTTALPSTAAAHSSPLTLDILKGVGAPQEPTVPIENKLSSSSSSFKQPFVFNNHSPAIQPIASTSSSTSAGKRVSPTASSSRARKRAPAAVNAVSGSKLASSSSSASSRIHKATASAAPPPAVSSVYHHHQIPPVRTVPMSIPHMHPSMHAAAAAAAAASQSNPLNFPAGSHLDYRLAAAMAAASMGTMPYGNLIAAGAMLNGAIPHPQRMDVYPGQTQTTVPSASVMDDFDSDDNGMQVDAGGMNDDGVGEKVGPVKRLQRKAELARESRLKKKMHIQELEDRCKQLESRIADLEQKHERFQDKKKCVTSLTQENDRTKHQKQLLQTMSEILASSHLGPKETELLKEQVNMFVETSREVQSQMEYNLDRVEDIISPSLQIKFTLWGLDQNDEFYDTPGLWSSLLCGELRLSNEQVEQLKRFRGKMHSHREQLLHAEFLLRELREKCGSHLDRFNREMDRVHNILTPVQLAKFYVWIEQNEWCMQMLNSMWSV